MCRYFLVPRIRAEEERLERRDALAERLKHRDSENTRKIMERSDKKVRLPIYKLEQSWNHHCH